VTAGLSRSLHGYNDLKNSAARNPIRVASPNGDYPGHRESLLSHANGAEQCFRVVGQKQARDQCQADFWKSCLCSTQALVSRVATGRVACGIPVSSAMRPNALPL